ncbi:hypothetical protein L0F63_001329, partial [Massospora cicadina]
KEYGCIFKAKHASDLKTSNYRAKCRKNLIERKYDHWTLEEENGRLVWWKYEGDSDTKDEILKLSCDHIYEAQVLHSYIRGANPKVLCPLFDKGNVSRSDQVRGILNGQENMRFIEMEINGAKGRVFSVNPGSMLSIIKKQKENHFAEALKEYIHNVEPNFIATYTKINLIFFRFFKEYPKLANQFNGTLISRSKDALYNSHLRLKKIIYSNKAYN